MDYFVTVRNCARCGTDHETLEFQEFINPIIVEDRIFSHWVLCPMTKEPIILEIIDDDTDSTDN